jgi:hypothetical protein
VCERLPIFSILCCRAVDGAHAPGSGVQGQRTLDFVLKNEGFIDKTLLIDVEILKIT